MNHIDIKRKSQRLDVKNVRRVTACYGLGNTTMHNTLERISRETTNAIVSEL